MASVFSVLGIVSGVSAGPLHKRVLQAQQSMCKYFGSEDVFTVSSYFMGTVAIYPMAFEKRLGDFFETKQLKICFSLHTNVAKLAFFAGRYAVFCRLLSVRQGFSIVTLCPILVR